MFYFIQKTVSKIIIWTLLGLFFAAALDAQTAPEPAAAAVPTATGAKNTASKGQEVRLKDIARIEGVRDNQLTGLGLVTGLAGQGDSPNNPLLQFVLSSLVGNLGVSITPETLKSKNAAVVTISALLPPFSRRGEVIDVQVASVGDAKSIDGGILLQSHLMAANGQTYAVAQGRVVLQGGKNAPKTNGLVPSGAIIEQEVTTTFLKDSSVSFLLSSPDFSTASAVGKALTAAFPAGKVSVVDSGRVTVTLPENGKDGAVDFISQAENIKVIPDFSAKVVVNKASGVVVAGRYVKIAKVAVSVRGAKVTIGQAEKGVSSTFAKNKTSEQFVMEETSTVEDLVTLLQQVGMDTDTVIEVLKAIDKAGALFGTLEVL